MVKIMEENEDQLKFEIEHLQQRINYIANDYKIRFELEEIEITNMDKKRRQYLLRAFIPEREIK